MIFIQKKNLTKGFKMKELKILIGASGSGKSTFRTKELIKYPDTLIHSWDDLRVEFAKNKGIDIDAITSSVDQYDVAYGACKDDPEFMQIVQKNFFNQINTGKDIIVDNVNASAKRRTFFITSARNKGYMITAYLFPIGRKELVKRAAARTDHKVPIMAVLQHYNSIQLPSIGEVDKVLYGNDILYKD